MHRMLPPVGPIVRATLSFSDVHGGCKFVPKSNVADSHKLNVGKLFFLGCLPIFLLENFVGSDFVFVALFSVGAFIVDLSCNADAEVLVLEAFSPCLCCFCTGKCF